MHWHELDGFYLTDKVLVVGSVLTRSCLPYLLYDINNTTAGCNLLGIDITTNGISFKIILIMNNINIINRQRPPTLPTNQEVSGSNPGQSIDLCVHHKYLFLEYGCFLCT